MERQTVPSSADSIAADFRWKAHSSILRDLYIGQNLSLKKVKEIMEENYGFPDFPESIYETRLRDTLKITKYLKGHDWQAIHNQLLARERCGKQSLVSHNGRILSQQKLSKERRRYRSMATRGLRQENQTPLPPNVTVRTPSPRPSSAILAPRMSNVLSSMCRIASAPQPAVNPSSPPRDNALLLEATSDLTFQVAGNAPLPTLDREASQFSGRWDPTATAKTKLSLLYRHYTQLLTGLRKGRPQKNASKVQKRKARESTVNTERHVARFEYLPQEDITYPSQSMPESPTAAARPEGLMLKNAQNSRGLGGSSAVTSYGSPAFPSTAIEDRQVLFQDAGPSSASAARPGQIPTGWVYFLNASRPALPSVVPSSVYDVAQSDADASAAAEVEHESPEPQSFHEQPHVSGTPDPPAQNSWMPIVVLSRSPSSVTSTSFASRGTSDKSRTSQSSSTSRSSHRPSSALGSRRHTSGFGSTKPLQYNRTLPVGSLRHLTPPDGLLLPEKSMLFARHYISSTFSTGLWTSSQYTQASLLDTECIKLDRWFNDFNPALEFLHTKRVNEAFRVLQPCFAATKDIIILQDPRIVIYICQQALRLIIYDNLGRSLARTLLRYAAELCKDVFTTHHPLYIIMEQMARMDHFEFAQSIPSLMECYFDHLEPFLDQTTDAFGFVTDLHGLTVSLMEAGKMIRMHEAKPMLGRLAQRAQRQNHSTLQLRIELASMYQRSRFFTEARAILEKIIDSEEAKKRPYERSYAYIMLMVTLRRMRVEHDTIIRVGYALVEFLSQPMEFANDLSRELFESQAHSTLVLALGKLEKDLRGNGRTEEADNILVRLNAAMNEKYGVEGPTDDPQAAVGALPSS